MLAPSILVLSGACLLGRGKSGALVDGSAGARGFSTSPSLSSVRRSQLAGSWWALVNPFSWQPAHRAFPHKSPALSLPPATGMLGTRCQPDHSGCPTLHLSVIGSLPNSVPPSWNLPDPMAGPSSPQPWNVFLQEGHLILPTLFQFPPCDCSVACALALVASWCFLTLPWYGMTWWVRPTHA